MERSELSGAGQWIMRRRKEEEGEVLTKKGKVGIKNDDEREGVRERGGRERKEVRKRRGGKKEGKRMGMGR